jgi:putative Holliday junction resolvase
MHHGHILAFDYGLKHIGVSVGQFVTRTASPLVTLRAKNGKPNWVDVDRLVSDWQPTNLVVGLPINMDGTESDMSAQARDFADALASRYTLPVALADERLTSRAAQELSRERSHELAAVLIAETWLSQAVDKT